MSLLIQPRSPIHIVHHPKSFEKKVLTKEKLLFRKNCRKEKFKKKNPKEEERHKHETSTNRHLQNITGGELFQVIKDTPRSIDGVHVVVNISMVGLAIDKRSSQPYGTYLVAMCNRAEKLFSTFFE